MPPVLLFKIQNYWQTPGPFRVFPYKALRHEYQELEGYFFLRLSKDEEDMDEVDGRSKDKANAQQEDEDDFLAKKQPIEQHVDTKVLQIHCLFKSLFCS